MSANSNLVKEPESTAIIRFQDCDPFGHLNNARYVDYFMNARTDQLAEHYGVQLIQEAQQESWVVSKSQIAFLSPARLGERVRIRTRILHFSERTLVVEGLMLSDDGQRLKAVLWLEFTYISLTTARPTNHPEHFMQLFGSLQIDGGFAEGFDRRIDALRAEFRRQRQPAPADAA
jgi:acyl-CoA thioester hydrolase